jgi:hypothetical protein
MNVSLSSTMPRYRNAKATEITKEQHLIFKQIVNILKPYSKQTDLRINTDQHYELWTKHGFRSRSFHPKHRKGLLFAGVVILKRNVGLYLFALHIDKKFVEKIDAGLLPLWKGGSAFHFDEPLSDLTTQSLDSLITGTWIFYQQNKWVS